MKTTIPDSTLQRMIDSAKCTMFRAYVEEAVSRFFRSAGYVSSTLISDCVMLNLVLHDEITPHSADEIIRYVHRKERSFYTTVDRAFKPVEQRFNERSKTVPGADEPEALGLRTVNRLVYVISLYLKNERPLNKYEVIDVAFPGDEKKDCGIPLD